MSPKVLILLIIAGIIIFFGYARFNQGQTSMQAEVNGTTESRQVNKPDGTPDAAPIPEKTIEMMTLTGTYVCLPTLSGAATPDCAFVVSKPMVASTMRSILARVRAAWLTLWPGSGLVLVVLLFQAKNLIQTTGRSSTRKVCLPFLKNFKKVCLCLRICV